MSDLAPAVVSEEEARAAARSALDLPGADGVEVVVSGSHSGVTRYARSEIIQNTLRREVRASVRVVTGDRIASASTNQLDEQHLRNAAKAALEAARTSRPDAEFPGLPRPQEVGVPEPIRRWDGATAEATPAHRAAAIAELLSAIDSGIAAGIYETSAHCFGIYSSTGVDCYDSYTRCIASCLVEDEGATGWGDLSSHDLNVVDVAHVATTAARKAARGKGAVDADPGTYEVILEAPAVSEFLSYLSYMGFGAKQVIEGESFMSARTGETVAAPSVTIADDASHPLSVGIGFDFEGVPKQRVAIIDGGRAIGPVTDLRTGQKIGGGSTGHYSGSNEFGPYAFNVVLEPGDSSTEQLIAGIDDGFLVTRFWYVNILDRPTTLLTGMTRDGIFRIRDGEISEPVHNFRFSQNVLDALATVRAVGAEARAFAPEFGSFGSTVAPPLRIGEFNFSSRTSH